MSLEIVANGLGEFSDYLDRLPDITTQAAMLAINRTASRKAVPLAREAINAQVQFPGNYLNDPKRLGVSKQATRTDLEAVVSARQRPTSLARWAAGTVRSTRKGGVTVKLKNSVTMKHAFLVRLRSGASITDDNFNIGLAVRLKPGESLANSTGAKKLFNNVYLLYGPSVDQVFRSVADDITPQVLDELSSEFLRQFNRLSE